MAGTATKVSQNVMVNEKEWLTLFPTQMTENYTSSVTFMKQLTVVAVSMITYLKNAFPEDSYSTETFAGLQLKILNNRNCADELAHFVSTALEQAFEAFDKKYIHQLALCFYENSCEPENLIEYHVFEYSYYPEGGVAMDVRSVRGDARAHCSLHRVKTRTTMLVRALSMFLFQQSQAELPLSYDVSLWLYYNDNAPESYQAPGFNCGGATDPLAHTHSHAVRLGAVHTPYHALVARAYTRGPPPASHEADPSDNPPVMTQVEKEDFQSCSGAGDAGVQCVCNMTDVGDHVLLTCQCCGRRQHAACYGFLRPPRAHACVPCAARDARAPADAFLLQLEPRRRECLSVFRRALAQCLRRRRVSGAALPPGAAGARALRLLAAHGVVPDHALGDLTIERKINHEKLNLTIQRFFHDAEVESDSVVERLAAETAAAPDDPLGDVLSPLERVALHDTARGPALGPPGERGPALAPLGERGARRGADATLQQYREAVMAEHDMSEELPLSGSHNPVKHVESIGKKKSMKRKTDDEDWLPKQRSGSKNKKIRAI